MCLCAARTRAAADRAGYEHARTAINARSTNDANALLTPLPCVPFGGGRLQAFSSTGAIEGSFAIQTGTLVSFSEEELVACEHTDHGCHGGLMDHAFAWVAKNGGLCSESSYPYTSGTGQVGQCQSTCNSVGTVTVCMLLPVAASPRLHEAPVRACVPSNPLAPRHLPELHRRPTRQ